MLRPGCILGALIVLALTSPAHVTAQSISAIASYAAGWNMVGGPANTSFAQATAFDGYRSGAYFSPSSRTAVPCQGYWAYFADPVTITLPSDALGPSQTCHLEAGWNLIGNPFAGAAQLPSGITAYHWNPDANTYDVVSAIPPGGSVWIESDTARSLPLTYVPILTRAAATVVISNLVSSGPYQVHVGDVVKLLLPSTTLEFARVNGNYLRLESSGLTGRLSCSGDPSCALSLNDQFWTWRGVSPGRAFITVTPTCAGTSPCGTSPATIEVDILP